MTAMKIFLILLPCLLLTSGCAMTGDTFSRTTEQTSETQDMKVEKKGQRGAGKEKQKETYTNKNNFKYPRCAECESR